MLLTHLEYSAEKPPGTEFLQWLHIWAANQKCQLFLLNFVSLLIPVIWHVDGFETSFLDRVGPTVSVFTRAQLNVQTKTHE